MGSSSNQSQPQGSSTSGSSSGTSQNVSTPYQQAHYDQLLGQADNLYKQGMPDYYSGQTVSGFTPAQMESMNLTSNWVTNEAQDMMGSMNNNYMDMMSGRINTGAGSPYGDMANAYRRQAGDQANQLMGEVRSGQVMSGQYGGSARGDMLNQNVMNEANQQVNDNLSMMYGNAYQNAQDQRTQALGQYGNIMNMPLEMSKQLYNRVGLPQQQLNQAVMNDQKQRYDYASMSPYNNLAQYAQFISGNMGGMTQAKESSSNSSTTKAI
jgi:hypothetical protein